MSKAATFIHLYEETSLDNVLSEEPQLPKRDYHFNFDQILNHPEQFNIVVQKVDDMSTMKHATDPWIYIVARLNEDDYIENAKVRIRGDEIVVHNDIVEASFDREGFLSRIYKNEAGIKADDDAQLEDLYIKGCSKQVYTILELTFR